MLAVASILTCLYSSLEHSSILNDVAEGGRKTTGYGPSPTLQGASHSGSPHSLTESIHPLPASPG